MSDKFNPKVITLCGSTRFRREFNEWNARLTLQGNVVFSVALHGHSMPKPPSDEEKVLLDKVHIAKINLSDEIFVLDVGGYIGSSTRNEIAHALTTGKKVRYLSVECPEWHENQCLYA